MHKPRRLLGIMAAFAMMTSTLAPVYANEVDLDLTELLDEDVTLGLSVDDVTKEASWYRWDPQSYTLTLTGQLPNTTIPYTDDDDPNIDNDVIYSFAVQAGINPEIVDKVVIEPNTKTGTTLEDAFYGMTGLKSIEGLRNLDTSTVSNMSSMFRGCRSLTSLDVSGFDTSNVWDMSSMFRGCRSLTSLDVSGLDTSNVRDMYHMFAGCSGLTSLDVSGFNTSNVWDMDSMFYGCSGLTSLDVSGFNTSNVKYMRSMFEACSGLTSLEIFGFDTSKVDYNNKEDMFFRCPELVSLKMTEGLYISEIMRLTNDGGWVMAGSDRIISGKRVYAEFEGAGTYIRLKPGASPVITAIEPGNRKMNVKWNAVKGASQYTVHYKTGSTEKTLKRDASKTGALINDIPNGAYDVWVTAAINGNETTEKYIFSTVLKEYYVPCKTQAAESGSINISWNAFPGAERYRVVCVYPDNVVRDTKTTSRLSFKWSGLKNGQTYGFYVQPYVDGVYPTFSRTDANDKKYIQWTCSVNSPMITKLSLGNQKVWLYYESVPRATKYYIYYRQSGQTTDTLAGTTTAIKFLVTKLKNNVSTEFYVKALVDGKLTPLKRPATRTTRAGMKPTITVSAGQAALKWSKYTDCKASATKYKVVLVNANYKQIDFRETTNLAFTWKSSTLKKGTKYGFYVVPYVNGEYIPFGLSHAEDKANVVFFTAK